MSDLFGAEPASLERVKRQLAKQELLREIVDAEPDVLTLLQSAAIQCDQEACWVQYEILKNSGLRYVGWEARNQDLRDSRWYLAYIQAIEELLPDSIKTRKRVYGDHF